MSHVIPAIINGEAVFTPRTFDVEDPSTGAVFCQAVRCGEHEVDLAVGAAREAYEAGWRRSEAPERARLLARLSEAISRNRSELAEMETRDTGKPLAQALADAELAARYFEFYANCIEALLGSTIPVRRDALAYTSREPYGVTGHIIPWNYPMQIGARTVAPALATGNCCILKSAEEAPSTPRRLAELALEAGFPAGALNVVPGLGEEAGAALARHPDINHLSFTGSVEVGKSVASAAGANAVPTTLELGGKSPNILLEDAPVDNALPVIVNSIIQNAGQTCSAGSRLLVHSKLHETVVNQIVERFNAIDIGPGMDDPDLGPLISRKQLANVEAYMRKASDEAILRVGGERLHGSRFSDGYFIAPALFDHVPPEAEIAQHEVFGPVLAVSPFDDVDDALAAANATNYGLIAAIWTRDIDRALWLSREIRAGQIFINTYGAGGGVEVPFGGNKQSGYGREKGYEALLGYTQTKSVVIRIGHDSG